MQLSNLMILVLCQLISATGAIVFITLGGIIGATLAGTPALATLPISATVVATAAATIPATLLMRRIGRGRGFALSSVTAALAALVAAAALAFASFGMFLLAALLFGVNMAFTQQYRYAAAESVEARLVPRAVSFVLLGAIGGAVAGPELATRGQNWIGGVPYAGPMLALAALYAVQALIMLLLRPTRADVQVPSAATRPLAMIVRQPVFMVAVLGGTAGYGLMTLVMTATPLSMHINDGYTVAQTAAVIRAHVLGMYVPSLVSGFLIERLGVTRMMFTGVLALTATSVMGLQGHLVLHYWWALVLLGIGWNFLYVGATTMLTYSYSIEERFKAQGVNEFCVFGASATASLLAGTIMYYFGWETLMLIPLPVLLLVAAALIVIRRDAMLPGRRAGAIPQESLQ
jgi:MFS family permease